ncbi:MAG: SRPBCC family protein [Solirubrobacteraceae bacterium]
MTDLIERELDLAAAPADVWRAITDPEWLSGWLADSVALDLRPGGEARFQFGDEVRDGWVEEVSSPGDGAGRLAFWWARGDEPASRVELVVSELDDSRTRLRVVETRPLEILDLVGIPFGGAGPTRFGPALVAA